MKQKLHPYKNEFIPARIVGKRLIIEIKPFIYEDGRKRLPRKSSKGYDLQKDTNTFFREVFGNINYSEFAGRYKVFITVNKGQDPLGGADLDNYSKAILDGITNSKKVWKNDNIVDYLEVKREYTNQSESHITVYIEKISKAI